MANDHEREVNDLSRIVIPARDMSPWNWDSQDRVVNVVPRTDVWLADTHRNFQEIDKTLEGHLAGIERSLLAEKPNPVKQAYGMENGISLPQARFLAYTDLLAKRKQEELVYGNRIGVLKRAYEEEAEEIELKAKSKNYASRDKNNLYKGKFKTQIDEHSENLRQSRRIQESIIRKAVLEIFSPSEDGRFSVEILPRTIEELKLNMLNLPQEQNERLEGKIDGLIESLTEYMQKTRDWELFTRYRYRKSPGIVSTQDDIAVLKSGMQMALNPGILTTDDRLQSQMQQLGRSFFVFLGKRASSITPGLEEKYPKLSLIYDSLSSAFSSKSAQVLRGTGKEIIDELYPDFSKSSDMSLELDNLSKKLLNGYESLDLMSKMELSEGFVITEGPALKFLLNPEYRMTVGLSKLLSLATVFSDRDIMNKSVHLSKIQKGVVDRVLKKNKMGIDFREENINFGYNLVQLAGPKTYFRAGVTEDLNAHLLFSTHGTFTLPEDPQDHIDGWDKVLGKIKKSEKISYKPEMTAEVATSYLLFFWQSDRERIRTVEKQNEWLKHQITDYSKWFVSPRGDRFSERTDHEIAERGIRSVTFNIDRRFPREHQVRVEWDISEINPTNYWLDKEGNLLDSERKPLGMDSIYYQLYSNLILQHLYVITSAELRKESERNIFGESEFEKLILWKRAHYRTYPEGSIYTLESEAAKEHARLIKQDYGIDIYKEIERRREIGSLLPNQVMTFVRETQPDQSGYEAKPMDLPFDPSWIPQRI